TSNGPSRCSVPGEWWSCWPSKGLFAVEKECLHLSAPNRESQAWLAIRRGGVFTRSAVGGASAATGWALHDGAACTKSIAAKAPPTKAVDNARQHPLEAANRSNFTKILRPTRSEERRVGKGWSSTTYTGE